MEGACYLLVWSLCSITEAKVKRILFLACVALAGCITQNEEKKPILLTPAHYRLAESLCKGEKGLLWIQFSPESPKEFDVVCHSGAVRTLRIVL